MTNHQFIKDILDAINKLALETPDSQTQYRDEDMRLLYAAANKLIDLSSEYQVYKKSKDKPESEWKTQDVNRIIKMGVHKSTTRDTNVGSSNYSDKKIQPWDIWTEYALNPWDADIVKRILRTKHDVGVSAAVSRCLDYKKIQHICQERIDQIDAGDPWYDNLNDSPLIPKSI